MDPQPSHSAAAPPRGAFIVVEGVDCCGKTTQSKKLQEHFLSKNVKVERWCFPDRTTAIGKGLNAYLQDAEMPLDPVAAHHMFVANRHEKRAALVAALRSGTTLIVDRYSYSGIAYSTAKGLRGLSLDTCRAFEEGLPAPDVVLFMRLGGEELARRFSKRSGGTERYETTAMQTKVLNSFDVLLETLPADAWTAFDGEQDVEALHTQVVERAERAVAECLAGRPIPRLWDGQPYAELSELAAL